MRMRTIRPEFFVDEDLVTLSPLTRILFEGMWCVADREGRLEDRPRRIKMQILPADECDVDAMLDELATIKVIHRYTIDGLSFIQVKSFTKFQRPHKNETPSVLPAMPRNGCSQEQPRSLPARAENGITENGITDKKTEKKNAPAKMENMPPCLTAVSKLIDGHDMTLADHLKREFGARWPEDSMVAANLGTFGAMIANGCLGSCDGSPEQAESCFWHITSKLDRKATPRWGGCKGLISYCMKNDREEARIE